MTSPPIPQSLGFEVEDPPKSQESKYPDFVALIALLFALGLAFTSLMLSICASQGSSEQYLKGGQYLIQSMAKAPEFAEIQALAMAQGDMEAWMVDPMHAPYFPKIPIVWIEPGRRFRPPFSKVGVLYPSNQGPDPDFDLRIKPWKKYGSLSIDLWAQEQSPLDLEKLFPLAKVWLSKGKEKHHCAFRWDRFVCGPKSWQYVGWNTITVFKKKQSCLWAHPIKDQILHIEFPPLRWSKPLKIQHALSDQASKFKGGAVIEVHWRVGQGVSKTRKILNRSGWQWVTLDPSPSPATLSIDIHAKNPAQRHFCFKFSEQ